MDLFDDDPGDAFALIYDHEAIPDISARDLERIPLLDDVFQAVLPAGHRLARRRRRALALSELSGEPWIGGAPTSAWHRIAINACRRAGFTPQADFASDDHIAVQALVAAGLGVSVIPGLAVVHPSRDSRCGSSARARPGVTSPPPVHATPTTAQLSQR